jgi:hypothetical protein
MTRGDARLPDATNISSSRPHRLRTIRREIERLEPGLRILAEDVLAHRSRIDLVASDARRRAVAVLVAEPEIGSRAIATVLAHRSWLLDHIADWLKFAPGLAIDAKAPVRAWVIAADFDPELIAAASALPDRWIELWRILEISRGDALHCHLLAVPIPHRTGVLRSTDAAPDRNAALPRFRTGLTARELGLSDEEVAQFE